MAMTRLSSMWLPPLSWAVLSPENENSDERQVHIKKRHRKYKEIFIANPCITKCGDVDVRVWCGQLSKLSRKVYRVRTIKSGLFR